MVLCQSFAIFSLVLYAYDVHWNCQPRHRYCSGSLHSAVYSSHRFNLVSSGGLECTPLQPDCLANRTLPVSSAKSCASLGWRRYYSHYLGRTFKPDTRNPGRTAGTPDDVGTFLISDKRLDQGFHVSKIPDALAKS